jgi:16S rRNA (guanine527-N7)-methyltransferase
VNLTRLVEGDDFWIAQVFDSLWPLRQRLQGQLNTPLRCIDVGTGGGFPGLAVAIALPQAQLTLVDSVGRKTQAVQAMAAALGLAERVQLRCERVELTGRHGHCRGQFDLAMARAVASAPVVAEYLVPLLQPGGQALLYRGQWGASDQRELERALQLLKAEIQSCEQRELPAGRGQRTALIVRASAPCPKSYPRAVGMPGKFPLGQSSSS